MWKRWVQDEGSGAAANLLPRLAIGFVFGVSGAVKFLYDNQGVGRFTKLGLPAPGVLATFVGGVEIIAGALIAVGLFTRLAAIPLIVDMVVALVTTKIPFLYSVGPEPIAAMPKEGFWAFAYQSRLDLTMLVGCAFLVAAGAGSWSLDAWRARRAGSGAPQKRSVPAGA